MLLSFVADYNHIYIYIHNDTSVILILHKKFDIKGLSAMDLKNLEGLIYQLANVVPLNETHVWQAGLNWNT